jgi:aspartate 1-decarboxylase
VELVHHATGERFTTFVQAGTEGSGEVRVHRIRAGDVVTILSWAWLHDGQTLGHRVTIVTVDASNTVVSLDVS